MSFRATVAVGVTSDNGQKCLVNYGDRAILGTDNAYGSRKITGCSFFDEATAVLCSEADRIDTDVSVVFKPFKAEVYASA